MSSLIPWRSFSDLDNFFGNNDWFLPILPRGEFVKPAMNVYETDKDIVAELNVPGFDPEKIDIAVENLMLKVSGKVEEKTEEKGRGYLRKEIHTGSFERMINLPTAIKFEDIQATYEKGILKIIMPKVNAKPSSKVKIKIKE
jgi:HSP20 family protein